MRWLLTIDVVGDGAGFTAMLRTGGDFDAKFVKIRQLGGFTGSAWAGGVGRAEAGRGLGVITIAGRGYGFYLDKPHRPATAAFTIKTVC
ncbi:MAG: lipoprotein LpqH [Mycobacterium sp.]